MNLDNKRLYIKERDRLMKLDLVLLKRLVSSLHDKRYLQGDGDAVEQHRLATYVLNQRTQSGSSLRFHLKNLVVS
jgi:hypothetical protein